MKTFEEGLASVREICRSKKFIQDVERLKTLLIGRPLILYGAGMIGHSVARVLGYYHIEVSCFCDKNKSGMMESGLPIISPQEIKIKYPDTNIIVCSVNYKDEIIQDLSDLGVTLEHIFTRDDLHIHEMTYDDILPYMEGYKSAFHLLEDDKSKQILLERIRCYITSEPITSSGEKNQYFDPELISLRQDEIFVDGGMYTGDTTQSFLQFSNRKYKHYYGFEPDQANFLAASNRLTGQPGITLVQKGLWSCEQQFPFNGSLASSSRLDDGAGRDLVEVTALDTFFQDKEPPTFIKMDIEGAELEALKGAEGLIRKYKPKLAICAYHRPEDVYKLPELVKSFRDDYKFYLRHYTDTIYETVLYGI